jgi:diguanylate cyclase (GGDEF)-like protein
MKIEDRKSSPRSSPGVAGVASAQYARSSAASAATTVRAPTDTASVGGIPEVELTPKVRDALMMLMREVENLRDELTRTKTRLADLERLADQDSLVPVFNRRAFVREMLRVRSYTERYGGNACLIFFDVNDLKKINDTLGHAAGDAAITQVAKTLVDNLRDSDVIGRLGGDEFCIILAQADEARARDKAAVLTEAVLRQPLQWEGKTVGLSVACGVYAVKPGDDPNTALAAADRAMYSDKSQTKSRNAKG